MLGPKKNKEEHRYYLLPGMGASNRRFHRRIRRTAIIVGIIVSGLMAAALYFLNRR
jgi:hypothetical protein